MPLRIRRGTDAERVANNFRPAQGELIFTTDTKKLYVGDGSTIGGTLVTGEGGGGGVGDSTVVPTTINDLSDVDVTGAISGSVLKYDGGNWVVGVDTAGSGGGASVLSDLTNVNFSNTPQDRWILRYDLASDEWRADPDDTGLNYPTLVSLTDTDFSNPPQDGWVLKYDLVNTRWVAAAEVIGSTLTSALDANGYSISDVGTITSTADITTTGDINAANVNAANVNATTVTSDLQGDVYNENGTQKIISVGSTALDAAIFTGNVTGNVTGNANGDHTGTFTGAITATGTLEGNIKGDIRATNDVTVLSSGSDGTNATFTGDVTGNLVGNVDGDLTGSVFGDDSTLMVDGVNNTINTQFINSPNGIITTTAVGADPSILEYNRGNAGALDPAESIGRTIISKTDTTTGTKTVVGSISLAENFYSWIHAPGGTYDFNNYVVFHQSGKVAISMGQAKINSEPAAHLEVGGAIKPGVYADNTARDAAITSPVAGMMVFNTTGTKFQGYTGSAWVDLN